MIGYMIDRWLDNYMETVERGSNMFPRFFRRLLAFLFDTAIVLCLVILFILSSVVHIPLFFLGRRRP